MFNVCCVGYKRTHANQVSMGCTQHQAKALGRHVHKRPLPPTCATSISLLVQSTNRYIFFALRFIPFWDIVIYYRMLLKSRKCSTHLVDELCLAPSTAMRHRLEPLLFLLYISGFIALPEWRVEGDVAVVVLLQDSSKVRNNSRPEVLKSVA